MDSPGGTKARASRWKRHAVGRELGFAGLLLAYCTWDTVATLVFEIGFAKKPLAGLSLLWQTYQFSLLAIVPGALAVRLAWPGYPTTLRRCIRIVFAYFVGATVGHWLAFRWLPMFVTASPSRAASMFAYSLTYAVLWAAFIVAAMHWWRRRKLIQQELHRTRIGLLAMKADRADAEMLRLRTQIEPHFLFNTIGNIVQMYQTDVGAGRRTLARLIDYMDTSHAHMRRQQALLEEELALTEGYLEIQRQRMGARLRYEIDVAPDLRRTGIPPAALLTLVENAIKHGLAPQIAGGVVRVSARREDESVVLSVADNGAGLRATTGRGLGLANVRARVQSLYGSAASLRLTSAEEGGTTATLRLPLVAPEAEAAA
jgi:signal transduction histidine kinase